MKRLLVSLAAVALLVAVAAGPVSADRSVWNNWHVHDGYTLSGTFPYTDANGLTHYGVSFGPQLFTNGDVAAYKADPQLWMYCPNATMKALLGTSASDNAVLYAGDCFNATTVIHLRLDPGNPMPSGWSSILFGGATFYYMLTSR